MSAVYRSRSCPIRPHTHTADHFLSWEHAGSTKSGRWWSANDRPAPKNLVVVDDRLTASQAMKYAAQGVAMLWLGDFHNARQLLGAMDRRLERTAAKRNAQPGSSPSEDFYRIRQTRAQRSRMLSLLLVPISFDTPDATATVPLPRAPQLGAAVAFGYDRQPGYGKQDAVLSLQELLGIQGGHQWFLKGVEVPALGARIHPHYGTFLPTRHEYVDLVAAAPLQDMELAFDIGTGTGVLAAVLAARGVRKVIGTDIHQRAVDCANDNFARLGIENTAKAQLTSMFPPGRASLVICNPPWLPGSAPTSLDAAVYDPGSKMLLQFLSGLPDHLTEDGEGWLVISDLAELLGLRTTSMLPDAIDRAGLEVIDRLDTVPTHARATDGTDPLHAARSRETTSLWRLRAKRRGGL
ncbi:class I SAM-dependent methyltransferase [Glutamicibacter sp. MNS18]|uniref:class I SAM-dependent methyltransferase n=1 Tax=Glutamicibacter sp. MNS18 TaxID=2989817 RepID=UPI0022357FE8|nr:class I SAM-dependent methyltransferase [Glutamicibacter sp. MNS18]MCW4465002.1 class I SAM-dependent methyltransferase [Glutamicibacter sp. MNS18]